MRVTVLGSGSWGTTVASLAAGRNDTMLWARRGDIAEEIRTEHRNSTYLADYELPHVLDATDDLELATRRAHVLVVAVPSHAFRSTLELAKPYVEPWIPVVSLTKGFERDSMLRMTEVIKEVLPGHPVAALSGPNIAKEIMSGLAAASVVATDDVEVGTALQRVFQRGLFRVYTNNDVAGCEIGGAVKNVIAIATGMGEGLSAGDNTRSAVISRGLAELTRLGEAMGGQPATFAGLAGLGDLLATCMSPHSRNRYVGEQLGRGRPLQEILDEMHMVAEGVKTAHITGVFAEQYDLDLPICRSVEAVVDGEMTSSEAYGGLLQTRPGHENEPG